LREEHGFQEFEEKIISNWRMKIITKHCASYLALFVTYRWVDQMNKEERVWKCSIRRKTRISYRICN
jgi:hypothetical protein